MAFKASVFAIVFFFTLAFVHGANVPRGQFLGALPRKDVEMRLQEALAAELVGGAHAMNRQILAIESSIFHSFQAVPKNALGRLAPPAVRYLARSYFAKERGWLIQGLEGSGVYVLDPIEMHNASILQDNVPAFLEAVLEAQRSQRGLSFADVVAMIAALEQLIVDEHRTLLVEAYDLNNLSSLETIEEELAHDVLTTFVSTLEKEWLRTNPNQERWLRMGKQHALKAKVLIDLFDDIHAFEDEVTQNYDYQHMHHTNPFMSRRFSFESVLILAEQLAKGYGRFANRECFELKAGLRELDPAGTGRVPLRTFYATGGVGVTAGKGFHFTETAEYLQEIGALDESVPGRPSVITVNYLLGPSNCDVTNSKYYTVCCLNECDGLMGEIESQVEAPAASPERLLGLVRNMSSSSVDAPRELPEALGSKLFAIAARHNGEIPIHGRLFAQWFHYAFPAECPYPSATVNASTFALATATATLSKESREQYVASAIGGESEVTPESSMAQWSDVEVLPLHVHRAPVASLASILSWVVRAAMAVSAFVALAGAATTIRVGVGQSSVKATDKLFV